MRHTFSAVDRLPHLAHAGLSGRRYLARVGARGEKKQAQHPDSHPWRRTPSVAPSQSLPLSPMLARVARRSEGGNERSRCCCCCLASQAASLAAAVAVAATCVPVICGAEPDCHSIESTTQSVSQRSRRRIVPDLVSACSLNQDAVSSCLTCTHSPAHTLASCLTCFIVSLSLSHLYRP